MQLATKTRDAIGKALEADQGAKYRGLLAKYIPLASDVYDDKEEDGLRSHLGASILGRECSREVWYSFRWATNKKFDGRMLRLFNRGHLEEPRLVALLALIGCEIWMVDDKGNQFRINGYKGHFGGSLDGVVLGLPEIPEEPALAEFKTHNTKSFVRLTQAGVQECKFEHYVQMQLYMGHYNLNYGLYMATNKNDDDLHLEIISFDKATCDRYEERAARIIDAPEPPPKISQNPSWFKCKFCDERPVCHNKPLPLKTCRSCVHAVIGEQGSWWCNHPEVDGYLKDNPIPKKTQLTGCGAYEVNLVFKNKV